MSEDKVLRTFYYRNTRAGSFTKTIVIVDGRVVNPNRRRRSTAGTHGEDYYLLSRPQWNRAVLLHFTQTTRGNRSLVVESAMQIPDSLVKKAEYLWKAGLTSDEVAQEFIREMKRLRVQQKT